MKKLNKKKEIKMRKFSELLETLFLKEVVE